jgi:hypothetical protein
VEVVRVQRRREGGVRPPVPWELNVDDASMMIDEKKKKREKRGPVR